MIANNPLRAAEKGYSVHKYSEPGHFCPNLIGTLQTVEIQGPVNSPVIRNLGEVEMRTNSARVAAILFLAAWSVFALCGRDLAAAAEDRPQGDSVSFFSQGQAVYDEQDHAKSQQQAIREFQGQAVVQAVGMFLNPGQMGAQFSDLQKKILAQPQKYVDSYQIFSETQTGGLYKVTGQVTVSVELLRNDLKEAGFQVQEAAKPVEPAASGQAVSTGGRESPPESAAGPQVETKPVEQTSRPGFRGLTVTKKEILWVVPEKWDQEWVIPTGGGRSDSLFAQSIRRQLDGYDYTLAFPDPGSLKLDYTGNVPHSQVIALAQGLGIQQAVVGSLEFREEQNKLARLDARLQVLRVDSGKAEGNVSQTQGMEELSNQEGASELASRIAPQLNNLLGQSEEGRGRSAASGGPAEKQAAQPGAAPGSWTVNLPSVQYVYWEEMERLLRENFKGMRITSLEMGAGEGTVRLRGVDGSFISRMDGTSLPSGATVRIDSYSTEEQAIKISFTPPATVQGEPQR